MMYIAIYPIAMRYSPFYSQSQQATYPPVLPLSVRATNVYEEKSLGVYENANEDDDELDNDAHWNRPSESRVAIWGKYLMRHARRQLSFGMAHFSVLP